MRRNQGISRLEGGGGAQEEDLIEYRVLARWISSFISFSVPLLGITSRTPASVTYIFRRVSLGWDWPAILGNTQECDCLLSFRVSRRFQTLLSDFHCIETGGVDDRHVHFSQMAPPWSGEP